MKRLLYIVLIVIACCSVIGCSTTRKATQTSNEQHITSSNNEDRHTETQTGEAVNINQTKNDLTNAVIEFTKTEYFDGSVKVDTTGRKNQSEVTMPRNRESREPPNQSGIKSITTGRITLNNEKAESTNTDINRTSTQKSDESISEDNSEDSTNDTKTEEKPKRGFIYYLSVIVGGIITFFSLICIAYGIYRIRNKI